MSSFWRMPISHPFLSEDFHIPWSQLTPDGVAAAIDEGLSLGRVNLENIRQLDDSELTYENTFGALESSTDALDRAWNRLNHLDSVLSSDEQRAALNAALPTVTGFYSSISLDTTLWEKLKAFKTSEKFTELDAIRTRYVEESCASFIQSGANLPAEKKTRITEVISRLSEITQKFGENVLDSTNAWELIIDDKSRLAGLPESAIAAAQADAAANNHGTEDQPKWRFTLQAPSMLPVMQHADDEQLRKDLWQARNTIGNSGDYDNTAIIWETLKLRQEKAELLGYKNFADLTLERRMAGNGHTALKFTEDLQPKVVTQALESFEELKAWKAEQTGSEPQLMEPWESSYWAEKRRKAEYDFDEEELRPYLPLPQVMEGMFDIVTKLFNVSIQERKTIARGGDVDTWHPECQFYELHDNDTKEHLGSFYTDWHPRSSKRGGAWMNSFVTGLPANGDQPRTPHLGLMCGNMTKPIGDQPALMTHREVETIFHEFGHLIHHLLGNVTVKSLSGTNVAWDFVELPSQIMENFCAERESLDMFARHHDTGEAIPDALFKKMTAAKNYMSANIFLRQLSLGKLDLDLHTSLDQYDSSDLDTLCKEILAQYLIPMATETPTIARQFSHIFSSPTGYACGYYSYKWAEVLDADAFTRFKKEGILNPETGKALRDTILSKGNSRPADELYRDFMGRDPEQAALLERSGITPATA